MNKIAIAKAKQLIGLDNYMAPTATVIHTHKLSSFYSSRSTNYAHCLNLAPFIIKHDADSIAAAGYAKTCKAVITLDESHPEVIEIRAQIIAERITDIEATRVRAEAQTLKIAATEREFDSVKEKLLAKWIAHPDSNGKAAISHKEANQLAWKKQDYISIGADVVTFRHLIKQYFNSL